MAIKFITLSNSSSVYAIAPCKVTSCITLTTVGMVIGSRETPTRTIVPPGLTVIIASDTAGELPQHSITLSKPPLVFSNNKLMALVSIAL